MPVELREMLYLDVERVRALAGQLWPNGIPEELELRSGTQKGGKAAVMIAEGSYGRVSEDVERRALAETLFPLLEIELEQEDFIVDASEWSEDPQHWSDDELPRWAQPGDLLRITAPGTLLDARHVGEMAGSFGAALSGAARMGLLDEVRANGSPQGPKMENAKNFDPTSPWREDHIAPMPEFEGFKPRELRGIAQLARGLFPEGVHLRLTPVAAGAQAVWCRLQEGRAYLDSEPEVLFSRYGLNPQPWTVVGVVGTIARRHAEPFTPPDIVQDDKVVRGLAMDAFNGFIESMTDLGFASGPQYPGFSIVPIAVYREIRRARDAQ